MGWAAIQRGESLLLLSPTGSGKTLAAFLAAIDRLMFAPPPKPSARCRLLYVSPLKALATDVEKNLRAPIAGILRAAEAGDGPVHEPFVALRSGDTPARERARIQRTPPDILITTPESLYLLLTSNARALLASVETVIVDEIHTMVATKRGAHLALSLERLEALRPRAAPPLQRVGLSATQRPHEEAARLLGGGVIDRRGVAMPRPVTIVDAGTKKAWDLRVELPAPSDEELAAAARSKGRKELPAAPSIWPSIHPRLAALIRAHRSTMIFVNSRRLAERLAAAINDVAGEELALAHHGSIAKEQRAAIEDRLKRGDLRAIVATSSLELGLDLGAVDLVIQIEAPPSIASGLQRIGRAGHGVGEVSRGVIFPKFQGDLLAAAAAIEEMLKGAVEATRCPKNPLDVLAQQIVATAAMDEVTADELYDLARRSAPFFELQRSSFDGVLDMLSGRYPSDDFAELKPRIVFDRETGAVRARDGAKRLAVTSGGTIPDRGLYGVYLAGTEEKSVRVGELDEEMVFESKPGEVFLLGASSWRIEEITNDRVLVSPAPGEPGKMPFWRGDRPGRPIELGRAIGALARTLASESAAAGEARLRERHCLTAETASRLVSHIGAQIAAAGEVPSDRTIVIERYRDELGDMRVCILSPFGARVHAPWSTAVLVRLREIYDAQIEGLWSDDGLVFRMPALVDPPPIEPFFPPSEAIEDMVTRALGSSSVFAARFRENAGRALLIPRRRPGQRSPLWAQRKRAADLLAAASRWGSFPIVLETARECLRDVFDLPGLAELLAQIERKEVKVVTVDSRRPSPFASSLLFSYVASFLYDGDAPLAERRAQALTVDSGELRALLGEVDLGELIDPLVIEEVARSLQRLDGVRRIEGEEDLYDLLRAIGDLTEAEARLRASDEAPVAAWAEALVRARRIMPVTVAGEERFAVVEDAFRLRDALGVKVPPWVPKALLTGMEGADPLGDLVARYARTHGPFFAEDVAQRLGIGVAPVREAIARLVAAGKIIEAAKLYDAGVLATLKRRSLAKLRKEVEPVAPAALGRLLIEWQGVGKKRGGAEAILAAIEQLHGAPIAVSALDADVMPARVAHYRASDLDSMCASGELTWMGVEPIGGSDGRIVLVPPREMALLAPPPRRAEGDMAAKVRAALERRGAIFFDEIVAEAGAFSGDVFKALWDLVWAGEATNDTLAPLRSLFAGEDVSARRRPRPGLLRAPVKRRGPPGSEGRWSLVRCSGSASFTERSTSIARVLLERYGVLARDVALSEGVAGGFAAIYEVLKAMEEAGQVRRGYFVAGLGAAQFALPEVVDRLRALRDMPLEKTTVVLAATDPASPWGATLPWPAPAGDGQKPQRAAGALVVIMGGLVIGYLAKNERSLTVFWPEGEAEREALPGALAGALAALVEEGRRATLLIEDIDGGPAGESPVVPALAARGFTPTSKGYFKTKPRARL